MSRIYCWDAGVFLAWLNAEVHTPEEDAAFSAAVDDVNAGRAMLVTSVMISCEVWDSRIPEGNKRTWYRQLFQREDVLLIQVTDAIAERAGHLREECYQQGIMCPSSEDSIYLATGIIYDATEIHSFDPHFLTLDERLPSVSIPIVKPRGTGEQLALPSSGETAGGEDSDQTTEPEAEVNDDGEEDY